MKIREIAIVGSKISDTTSCGTTSSGLQAGSPQDIVPEMINGKIVEQPDHSAISEGVTQILRRKAGGAPTKGFRCTSGPRKGRIVAKPSTCFARRDPVKGAKIRKKRQQKAKVAGIKLGRQKRSGAVSRRLKGTQVKRPKGPKKSKPLQKTGRKKIKSRIVK
jgi:hypothetical protein